MTLRGRGSFYRYQELNAENAGVSFLWEKLYELINSANQIIASQAEGGDAAATAEAMFFVLMHTICW